MRKSLFLAASLIMVMMAVSPATAGTPEGVDPEAWAKVQARLEAQGVEPRVKAGRDLPVEVAKLLPQGDPTGRDANFGRAIAVEVDTMVVGANDKEQGAEVGAAYIFQRDQGGIDAWDQVVKLMPADGSAGDSFGWSVAISEDTVVVGARWDDDNGSRSGSAYIFGRNQGGADQWGQVARLLAIDGADSDFFGNSVSISGDTVVVGAYGDDDSGSESGSVYVFGRDHGGADSWGHIAKLTASDGARRDYFGRAVSIDGDTLVVGALNDDDNGSDSGSVYIFDRNQGGIDAWGQEAKITASDGENGDWFGRAVSTHGDIVVVGVDGDDDNGYQAGSAYVYCRDRNGKNMWEQMAKLNALDGADNDRFGGSVSVWGDTVVVGSWCGYFGPGSAYIFARNHGGTDVWGQVAEISPSDGFQGDYFGIAVSLSGDTIAAGSAFDDDFGYRSGSAYIFGRHQGGFDAWGQVSKQTASGWLSARGDEFGESASISGDIAVVGARYDDDGGDNFGSAYVFARDQGTPGAWGLVKQLQPWDGETDDRFGSAVSISGDIIAVGVPGDDENGYGSGSVSVFHRDQGGVDAWGQVAEIVPLDGASGDGFGNAVSLSSDTLIVGAVGDDDNGYAAGAAYVFGRNQGGTDAWGQVAKLTASDGAEDDRFGTEVALCGDIVVVGAFADDDNGVTSGSAYVFDRSQGGANQWGQIAKLTASDGAIGDKFGSAVSVSGDIVVVGADGDDSTDSNSGSAYIFDRNLGGPNAWGQVTKIMPSDGAQDDRFGGAVSISADTVVVGANGEDNWDSSGSAYVFQQNHGGIDGWGEVAKLTISDGNPADLFGSSVSNDGDTVIVGSPGDSDVGLGSGSAVVFGITRNLEVQRVGTMPDTGDGVLAPGEWVVAAITDFSVLFSKSMLDPVGNNDPGDVTNPSNWLLVGAGPDGVVQTTSCAGGLAGDDVTKVTDTFIYDEAQLTVGFRADGGATLGDGAYTLFACGTLQSIGGLQLDGNGDGVGGDDFLRSFAIDTVVPFNPTISSPSHTPGVWSTDAAIEISWSGGTDGTSGVAGYSVVMDANAGTEPDGVTDVPHGTDPHTLVWDCPDGNSLYYHLRACDVAGNCASAQHLGPFWIDATGPTAVTDLISTSHLVDLPADDVTIDVQWTAATDEFHGVEGYAVEFSRSSWGDCDQVQDTTGTSMTSPSLDEGVWHVRVCAVDGLDNWGPVASAGPFFVDTIAPMVNFVGSEGGTTDGYLVDGESILEALTQLVIHFTEPMFNPAGNHSQGDLTNPLNYRVLDLGPDGVLNTTSCASVVGGDDREVLQSGAPFDWGNTDKVVSITGLGHRGVPRGRYVLEVCAVEDLAGHKVVPWTQGFIINAGNLLVDPNFDDGLNEWDLDSPYGNEISWTDNDNSTHGSGGVEIDPHGGGEGKIYELSQCLDVDEGTPFALSGETMIYGNALSPTLKAVARYFRNAGCVDLLETVEAVIAQGSTGGTWIPRAFVSSRAPIDTLSVRVGFVVEGGTTSDFRVTLDEVAFLVDTLFVDGFETGDTTGW